MKEKPASIEDIEFMIWGCKRSDGKVMVFFTRSADKLEIQPMIAEPPNWEWGPPVIMGYEFKGELRKKDNDPEGLGQLYMCVGDTYEHALETMEENYPVTKIEYTKPPQ